jgi:hypothetical protein
MLRIIRTQDGETEYLWIRPEGQLTWTKYKNLASPLPIKVLEEAWELAEAIGGEVVCW